MRERIIELERSIHVVLRKVDAEEQPEKDALDALRTSTRELRLPESFKYGTEGSTEVVGDLGREKDQLEDREGGLDSAPLLSLFNNFVVSREEDNLQGSTLAGDSKGDSSCSNERNSFILRNLRALIPSRAGLSRILQESRISLCVLLTTSPELPGLRAFLDDSNIDPLSDYLIDTLHSENVTAVAKVVASLATCLQQLPWDFDIGTADLPAPSDVLQRCFMESVEALLAPDEGGVASLDGVKCLLVQARYYINLGLVRKAWVLFRRALTFAHLLGTPQSSLRNPRTGLWLQLWTVDKLRSVMLGLPCAIHRFPCRVCMNGVESDLILPPRFLFMFNLARIAGDINDRNLERNETSYSKAQAIDSDLQRCAEIMPAKWWNTIPDHKWPAEDVYDMFFS
jgi:hypothetical protein